MKQIEGVTDTQVGYANGTVPQPSYQQVKTGDTGAAETVKVTYDADAVTLPHLIDLYFKIIDPTSMNRQGEDSGTQYRTGIYYTEAADRETITAALEQQSAHFERPLAVECEPLRNFYAAEDYHQDYLDKNPGGYCHVSPELFELARKAGRN